MIKARFKYLIILFILLSGIVSQGVNFSYLSALNKPFEKLESSQSFHLGPHEDEFVFLASSFNNPEKYYFEYDEKYEEDDDESNSSKKKVTNNSSPLFSFFNSHHTKSLFSKNPQTLRFSKQFLYLPFHKLFIVFRVFRI